MTFLAAISSILTFFHLSHSYPIMWPLISIELELETTQPITRILKAWEKRMVSLSSCVWPFWDAIVVDSSLIFFFLNLNGNYVFLFINIHVTLYGLCMFAWEIWCGSLHPYCERRRAKVKSFCCRGIKVANDMYLKQLLSSLTRT